MYPNSKPDRDGFAEITFQRGDVANGLERRPASTRLPRFIGARCDAAESLSQWKLAIVAAGSVGRRIALAAARLQPHTLWIVDPSRYKAESVITQEISPADRGQLKATNTARACKAISPRTRVFACDGPIQQLPLDALAEADVCALSTDNLKAEVETGQRMLRLGVPLAHAGVHGDSLVAQVRLFANDGGQGPCPACGFSQAEWDHLNRQTTFRCGGAEGVPEEHTETAPTMSTAFLCSLAADLTMMQLIRHRLGLGKPVVDTMVQYCGYTHATTVAPLTRNANCPCEHIAWRRVSASQNLDACSLREAAAIAGMPIDQVARGLAYLVDEFVFVESAWCCGRSQKIGRFYSAAGDDNQHPCLCEFCRAPLKPQPYFSHRSVPASAAPLDISLEKLGAKGVRYIGVRRDSEAAIVREESL